MSEDFGKLFKDSAAPAPRADLTDRIMAAAKAQTPLPAANDRKPWVWTALAGIAATLVAGFFVFSSQPDDTELWASEAAAAGFGDLYSWVNDET